MTFDQSLPALGTLFADIGRQLAVHGKAASTLAVAQASMRRVPGAEGAPVR
jgi:hypothetical protein